MQKKRVEQPPEEQKRNFGKEEMHLIGEIATLRQKMPFGMGDDIMEVWESKRKCHCDGVGITSAVRVEVRNAGKVGGVTVFEVRDGKLFSSRFDASLKPIAAASRKEIAEEHLKDITGFVNQGEERKEEFFNHMMDSGETTTRVQGTEKYVHALLNKKIVSELQLEWKMSCKWTREGDALVMTPVKETSIPMRIIFGLKSRSFIVVIPEEMQLAHGLKRGDYVEWKEEGGMLSLRKAKGVGQYSRKIFAMGGGSIGTTIPITFAEELKVCKGMHGVWTFDDEKVWLELMHEKPNITSIAVSEIAYAEQFRVSLPAAINPFKAGEEVVLKVKEGKLYITPKKIA